MNVLYESNDFAADWVKDWEYNTEHSKALVDINGKNTLQLAVESALPLDLMI